MFPRFRLVLAILALFVIRAPMSLAEIAKRPLSQAQLLALVAGNSLSETIVQEIGARGLNFHPDDKYRALLTEAGADPRVLTALNPAKVSDERASADQASSAQSLEHLAAAGKLLRNAQYDDATRELTQALQSGAGVEAGFVMVEVLVRQEKWTEAEAIMMQIQSQDPDFPESHTKQSYLFYRVDDAEGGLREARSALAENPNDAEAHKNAGLALEILKKFEASEQEYQEALRLKPDYAAARYDLGILFHEEKKYDRAIEEYKKAITLDPANGNIPYNMGHSFEEKGDLDSAIHEYREAIRFNPDKFEFRSSLGHALESRMMYADAVKVFREMEAKWPDSPLCHDCLGNALYGVQDLVGAEKEFRQAIALDPTDAYPQRGLGRIRLVQKDYDTALNEFREAENLDESSPDAYIGAGSVLLAKKDFSNAEKELRQAEQLRPSDPDVHGYLGDALIALGDTAAAINEFKQAVELDPKAFPVRLKLAAALETKGEWAGALDEYRQAALMSIPVPGTVVSTKGAPYPAPQAAYQAAQARFRQHLASLRASGKSAEAAALEASIRQPKASENLSEALDAVIQKANQAASAGRFEEIERDYKDAVALAEKVQPRDDRLMLCLIRLANFYAARKQADLAETNFQQALKVTEELHGPDSPELTRPLHELGHYYLTRQNYTSGLEDYQQAVIIDEKAYGESSSQVADSLRQLSFVFLAQKDYAKAEPPLLRAQGIMDALVGPGGDGENLVLWTLCNLYDKWNKPEKADPRYRQMLAILERQYGPESPVLLSVLTAEASMLHQLGRADEAAQFEKRAETIRAAAGQNAGASAAQLPN